MSSRCYASAHTNVRLPALTPACKENTVLLFFLVSCLSHLQPPLIHDMFRLQLKELSMVCICTLSDPGKDAIVLHSAAAARIESLGCHKEVLVLSSTGTSS